MRRLALIVLLLVIAATLTGCARMDRIVNDIQWMFFDMEPSRDN